MYPEGETAIAHGLLAATEWISAKLKSEQAFVLLLLLSSSEQDKATAAIKKRYFKFFIIRVVSFTRQYYYFPSSFFSADIRTACLNIRTADCLNFIEQCEEFLLFITAQRDARIVLHDEFAAVTADVLLNEFQVDDVRLVRTEIDRVVF